MIVLFEYGAIVVCTSLRKAGSVVPLMFVCASLCEAGRLTALLKSSSSAGE